MKNLQIKFFGQTIEIDSEILEIFSNMSWFLMDIFWMLGLKYLSIFCIAPTFIFTALFLFIDKRFVSIMTNSALVSWVLMNSFWMLDEYYPNPIFNYGKLIFLFTGIIFVISSIYNSSSLKEALSPFKRFRLRNLNSLKS